MQVSCYRVSPIPKASSSRAVKGCNCRQSRFRHRITLHLVLLWLNTFFEWGKAGSVLLLLIGQSPLCSLFDHLNFELSSEMSQLGSAGFMELLPWWYEKCCSRVLWPCCQVPHWNARVIPVQLMGSCHLTEGSVHRLALTFWPLLLANEPDVILQKHVFWVKVIRKTNVWL